MRNPVLKYLFTAVFSAAILALDQAVKIFIQIYFGGEGEKPLTVIEGFFNISYIKNSGGAFGLFAESHELIRFVLFLLFPLLCAGFIFAMLRETQNRWQILALSAVLGGALGNYLDRIRMGYVVDFIDWHFKGWHWPTFNIADSFIVMGVIALLFFHLKEIRAERKARQA